VEEKPVNLTIDLSEQNAAALEALARAARMPAEHYLAHVVARALERQHQRDAENLAKHLDYMASQVAPETTTERDGSRATGSSDAGSAAP
jgi:predicted nucleic acid-binding protein